MSFLNETHRQNFEKLSKQVALEVMDGERSALMYIISGNTELFNKRASIYDFDENILKFTTFRKSPNDFCSSSRSLIRLGANLYNGYSDKYTNPLNLLMNLNYDNCNLAINALYLRFFNY
jgi:hypothetical protein